MNKKTLIYGGIAVAVIIIIVVVIRMRNKAAQAQKNHSGVPDAKSQEVQQVKYGNKPALNKPVKKAAGRGR
jgi:hypothetical protein